MSVLGPDALYLHIPHSGGTSVGAALERAGLGTHVGALGVSPHLPAHELPSEWFVGRHVWATVRNPWAWHVSAYHSKQRGITFRAWLADMCACEPGRYSALLDSIAADTGCEFVALDDLDRGLEVIYGRPVEVGHENVTGPQAGHALRPTHGPVADYYDDETIEWVREAEAQICERFGYDSPTATATRGVV